MNNILNGVSNRYLSFHLPCSFACRETLDYQRAIFGAIRKTFPDFSKDIERCLRRPYVVFLNPALDSCVVSWDQRKGFGFGGCVKGGVLTYSEAAYFQTDYPEYLGRGSVSEFESLRNAIERGRRIVFKRGGKFQIYRSSKLLREFKNNGGNRAFLFNFV